MKTGYEKSLFYQINSTSKYFDILFEQYFKELNAGITAKEHLALSIISQTENCCQRDLARIMLKDRANTGKLAKKLENLGFIKIETKTKNNKLVKILSLTEKGEALRLDITNKILPSIGQVEDEMTQESIDNLIEGLKKFRKIVQKTTKTNI